MMTGEKKRGKKEKGRDESTVAAPSTYAAQLNPAGISSTRVSCPQTMKGNQKLGPKKDSKKTLENHCAIRWKRIYRSALCLFFWGMSLSFVPRR